MRKVHSHIARVYREEVDGINTLREMALMNHCSEGEKKLCKKFTHDGCSFHRSRQPRATASIHQFSDEEDPVPLKPPIPVPHPSEDVRAYPRPTSSHAAVPIRSKPDPTTKSAIAPTYTKADPTIQSKSAPMISKAIRKKTGAGGLVRAAPNPLDPFLIVDPNLRGKLGIQPQTNSKLIRSAVRPNKAVVSHSRFVEASAATVPVVLDHPAPNSLKLLKQHIKTIKDSKFNPVEAIAKLMVEDEDTIKQVHGRVTAKVSIQMSLYFGASRAYVSLGADRR